MLTKTEKLRYLALAERTNDNSTELSEYRVNETLRCIDDQELRLTLDSLIGELVLAHEYKGFEVGRRHGRRRGK